MMEIVAPFPRDGPIAGFDFLIDHGDDEMSRLKYQVTTIAVRTGRQCRPPKANHGASNLNSDPNLNHKSRDVNGAKRSRRYPPVPCPMDKYLPPSPAPYL